MPRQTWWEKVIGKERPKRVMPGYNPTYQDSFYRPEHGSGWVKHIDWQGKSVDVVFADGHRHNYEFSELEDAFVNRYGGIYWPND